MRLILYTTVILSLLFVSFTSTSSAGEEMLLVNHSLSLTTPVGENVMVTLDMTVRNTGAIDLYGVNLIFQENSIFLDPTSQALNIEMLAAGEEVIDSLEIASISNEQLEAFLAGELLITGTAIDIDSNTININAISQGVAE